MRPSSTAAATIPPLNQGPFRCRSFLGTSVLMTKSSTQEEEPKQKGEECRQARVDENRKNNRNLLAQEEPMGESRQHNACEETDQPRRKLRAQDVKSRSPGASAQQQGNKSNPAEATAAYRTVFHGRPFLRPGGWIESPVRKASSANAE